MRLYREIVSSTWWQYTSGLLLAIAYATAIHSGKGLWTSDWLWLSVVSCCTLCYALRVWHRQVHRLQRWTILVIEICALGILLWQIGNSLPLIFLIFYLLFVSACHNKCDTHITLTRHAPGDPHPRLFFLADFYQIFLPFSLALYTALVFHRDWIILIVHVIVFSRTITRLLQSVCKAVQVKRLTNI